MERMREKVLTLQELCNKYGDFKVCHLYRHPSKGHTVCSKHFSIMELWERNDGMNVINWTNQRQILPHEIVLDFDGGEGYDDIMKICDQIEKYNLCYYCYATGSKGYHIHIFSKMLMEFNPVKRKVIRQWLIKTFNADLMKSNENTMIQMEFERHWKTGKYKSLIRSNEDDNPLFEKNLFKDILMVGVR